MPKFKKFNNRKKKSIIKVPPPPPLEFPVGSAEYVRVRNLETAQRDAERMQKERENSLKSLHDHAQGS